MIKDFDEYEDYDGYEGSEGCEGCEKEIRDPDFIEEQADESIDYDGIRLHKYDDYTGELTPEIALVKYERLLRAVAGRYAGQGAEYEELFQLGQIELWRLLKKYAENPFLTNILKRRLARYISYHAERIRKEERHGSRAPIELLEKVTVEATGGDWHTRETAMFDKVSRRLTRDEMKLVMLIYGGASQRQAARELGITHTAVGKRLAKIREKLLPLVPWLEDRTEFPCTNYAEETYSA